MKKILVTGGAGYIGSFMVKKLAEEGFNPVILDNLSQKTTPLPSFTFYEKDLLDKTALDEVFEKEKFDGVMHFAALALVSQSMQKPGLYFEHNVNTTVNLLEAMAKFGVKNLIFSSSCSVYGTPKTTPVDETFPLQPDSVYAATKVFDETIIDFYSRIHGLAYVSLRYFNASGAAIDGSMGERHTPETHIIPCAINALLKNETFTLRGNDYPTPDGTCIRDYIHVLDLAGAHIKALNYLFEKKQSNIFNLGTSNRYSNLEVLKAIEKVAGKKINVEIGERRAGDPSIIYSDNRKTLETLNWKPEYSDLETIIASAFKWHSKAS